MDKKESVTLQPMQERGAQKRVEVELVQKEKVELSNEDLDRVADGPFAMN